MSAPRRIAILFGIVAVALTAELARSQQPLPVSPYDKLLLDLDEEAMKQAYKTQVQNLFAIWMKDDDGQPQRALVGVQQARHAFIGAMTEIEKRRRLIKEGAQ
jgi:hypothetical protein